MSKVPAKFQSTVRWIAIPIMTLLTLANFLVSFARLETFIQAYGGNGMASIILASTIDLTALCGLLVALAFQSNWARTAFVFALLVSGFANGFICYYISGAIGLGVGILPIILLELTYRISLALILKTTPADIKAESLPIELPPPYDPEEAKANMEEILGEKFEDIINKKPRKPRGPRKMNQEKADEMRNLASQGESRKSLATRYDVSYSTVSQILTNKIWIKEPTVTLEKEEYDKIVGNQ